MIARELLEFFAGFSPDGGPARAARGDLTFLSNVNACYARECWEEIRFADVAYAEDQAFGRAMLEAGWVKVYHPARPCGTRTTTGRSSSCSATSTSTAACARRAATWSRCGRARRCARWRGDARWMRDQGVPARELRALVGPLGGASRRPPGGLARSARARSGCRRGRSARCRSRAAARRSRRAAGRPRTCPRGRDGRRAGANPYEAVLRAGPRRAGAARRPGARDGRRGPLHVATVIPPFARGSGGHSTIFTLLARLERMGHTCSIWMHDPRGRQHGGAPAAPPDRGGVRAAARARCTRASTTGTAPTWRWPPAGTPSTRRAAARLPGAGLPDPGPRAGVLRDLGRVALGARAPTGSACTGSPPSRWLRDLLASRYGQRGTWFRLGVDHGIYRRARSSGGGTRSSSTPARSRRGGPCRSALSPWRS